MWRSIFCIDAILNGNYDTGLTLKTKLYIYWTINTSNIHRFGCFSFYYVMWHLHGLLRPLFLDIFLHEWLPLIEMQLVCLTPFGYLFCQTRTGLACGWGKFQPQLCVLAHPQAQEWMLLIRLESWWGQYQCPTFTDPTSHY